ncbi:MAG: hypothetical protein ACRBBW_03930 [Cellvibrionaceae bacterium]
MQTNIQEFFDDLDGGVFGEKLAHILSDVAGAVIDHNKQGEVNIKLQLKRIGNSYQVGINHKLTYVKPTAKGKASEENTTETPMHVGKGGRLTLFPENQGSMFDKTGNVTTPQGEKS